MEPQDYIGKTTGSGTVHLERGAISRFASAVVDENPVFHHLSAAQEAGFPSTPLPPTWTFAASFQGARREEQLVSADTRSPMEAIIAQLMQAGGMILHGEQEFCYHSTPCSGDVLHWEGRFTDVYSRESNGKTMTFVVMETVFRNESGEPVVTEVFNLIHRV